ncbi:hypothetical protein [Pelagicoccus mobilis]|nr:hypothetical protein [Pelagicoccus mobilis]
MRNNESELSHPIVRFIAAYLTQPLIWTAAYAFFASSTSYHRRTILSYFLSILMTLAIPALCWFFTMKRFYEKNEKIRTSRNRFSLAGALFSITYVLTFFFLVLLFLDELHEFDYFEKPAFLGTALASGYIASHVVFPRTKH